MSEDTQLTVSRHVPGLPFASPTSAQICAALATAQGKFKTPKRTKPVTMKFRDGTSTTFHYAPLEEIIDAVKEGLAEACLSRQQYLIRSPEGYYVRTVIWHASGEWIASDYPIFATKEGAQGFASGVTYARRYGLSLALGLAPEDDDDANVADGNTVSFKPPQATQTREPKEPAPNIMQQPPDTQTDEVLQALPATETANEAVEARAALLTEAAMGKGKAKDERAEMWLRKHWNETPLHMQELLRPRTKQWLKVARDVDQAHAMAQEQQG